MIVRNEKEAWEGRHEDEIWKFGMIVRNEEEAWGGEA